jgi:ectoine hydroxylase-related dioxygenase (phytanoyl-CoA dioxygenase family)
VELVSGVAGEDLILWGCHVFCKPAGDGFETPWHQDGHYRPIRPLATGAFDDARAVDIELQPGQMSLHDVYMIHGANANRSAQRRTGVPVNFAHRPLWLVRGVDRHGGNDFATGHRHPGNPAGA